MLWRRVLERHEPSAACEPLEPRLLLAGQILITEFMAINDSTLVDENGEFSDWLEIHNPTASAVDLTGWKLKDGDSEWTFPSMSLGAGQYRTIFASQKDRTDPAGELHTDFRLSGAGEYLGILDDTGAVVHEYDEYPDQDPDVSYGLGDGGYTETILTEQGGPARVLVPTDDALGTGWTGGAPLDETGWLDGTTGVGFSDAIPLNFNDYTIQSFGSGQDLVGTYAIEDGGASLRLTGNRWKKIAAPFYVTADTVLEFDFSSSVEGEIHAIGLEDDNELSAESTFQLYGRDVWAQQDFNDYSAAAPTTRHYVIPVGQYFTGQMTHMIFANDEDVADPTAESVYSNIVVRGSGGGGSYGGLVGIDPSAEMLDTNASAYLRAGFFHDTAEAYDSLLLRMQYDDGFVAYINGVKVAERNAPASPTWDSAATDERTVTEAVTVEQIDITAYSSALVDGTNILAIHGLNSAADDPNFLILPTLVLAIQSGLTEHYFATPSPGEPNNQDYWARVADTRFDHDRGFYEAPFNLTITTDTPEAVIRYTTNGTEPTAA